MNLIVLGKEMISIGMAIGANETSAAHSFALFFATKEKKPHHSHPQVQLQ